MKLAFYDIDELELHKIASDGEIQSDDDYDALPYTYKLYDSQRYVRHDWFKDKKNVNSMFWTEAGVRYLVEMLGRKRIFIQSRYKVRTPYDPPSDT